MPHATDFGRFRIELPFAIESDEEFSRTRSSLSGFSRIHSEFDLALELLKLICWNNEFDPRWKI